MNRDSFLGTDLSVVLTDVCRGRNNERQCYDPAYTPPPHAPCHAWPHACISILDNDQSSTARSYGKTPCFGTSAVTNLRKFLLKRACKSPRKRLRTWTGLGIRYSIFGFRDKSALTLPHSALTDFGNPVKFQFDTH